MWRPLYVAGSGSQHGSQTGQELHIVDAAPLPGRAHEHFPDRLLEPRVRVRDHALDALQAAAHQAREERAPQGDVFAEAHVRPEHFAHPSARTP